MIQTVSSNRVKSRPVIDCAANDWLIIVMNCTALQQSVASAAKRLSLMTACNQPRAQRLNHGPPRHRP